MATQLIAAGSTAASFEFTVAAGEQALIFLEGSGFLAIAAVIEMKGVGGGFTPAGYLGSRDTGQTISSPGNYRVSRPEGSNCGVSRG